MTGKRETRPTTMIQKNFCTTREAADLLGMSVSTVQLWVESGILQAWKTAGGHRRVLRDSVDALLQRTPPAVQSTVVAATPPRLRVLVVEDDVHLLRLYQANLAAWPMQPEVKLTDNAISALLEVSRRPPDFLITDLQIPGMDGFNMLRVLHQAPEVSNTTIVVVSGLDSAEIRQKGGIPAGIEILPKPIPFERLLAIATGISQRAPGVLRPA